MARYQPRDADFVLAGDERDEDLPAAADLDPLWLRRVGRPAAYLAAAGLVAACLLRVTTPDPHPLTAAAPADSGPKGHAVVAANDLAAQGFAVEHPVVVRASGSLITDDLTDRCPAGQSCLTSSDVPTAVLAALHAAYPDVADVSVRTVSLPGSGAPRLLGRIVYADTGSSSLTVQVLAGHLAPAAGLTGAGAEAIAVAQRPSGPLTVRVTVAGTAASGRADAPSVRLAADPRVLAVG